ncbi:MAG TPA: arginine deiminase-related protein [Sphingomicrobium sp.]|nr:arginine deiminase-related protein [Sphingomicrobium sp.]
METQSASAVLLVRPAAFGFNAEAAESNVFSHASSETDFVRHTAVEFEALARSLSDAGVETVILDDTREPAKPDAVFPNNWFSTHADGTMVVYPMATAPRRLERRVDDVRALLERQGFEVRRVVDLTSHEKQGHFLEGTGSLVLDRPNRRAFASLSLRTHADVIADFDRQLGYSTFVFDACDPGRRPIYHTNVLLSLGTRFAALCLEAVAEEHRHRLVAEIEESGRTVIPMSFAQLRRFGCNLLELQGKAGPVIALSARAIASLKPDQLRALEGFGKLVAVAVPTIESVGGGSVRCMIAEIHLPRN